MTKFKVGQKWRMRNGEIDVITKVCSASIRAEKHRHRYCDGCFCNDGDHDYDLVTLIKDAPEDDLVKRANYAINDMQGRVEAGKLAMFQECIARVKELEDKLDEQEERIEELEDKLRSMALDYMAADGQAVEAHQAQLAAEAKLAKAVWAIEKMRDASDAMMLYFVRTTLAELEGQTT